MVMVPTWSDRFSPLPRTPGASPNGGNHRPYMPDMCMIRPARGNPWPGCWSGSVPSRPGLAGRDRDETRPGQGVAADGVTVGVAVPVGPVGGPEELGASGALAMVSVTLEPRRTEPDSGDCASTVPTA